VERQTGEEVFYHGHPSWRSILGFYIRGLLVAVVAGVIAGVVTRIASNKVEVAWVLAAVLVVFVIVLVAGFVKRLWTTYTITSQRLTIDTGLLSRDLHEARLDRVQAVNARQSLLDRMLRIGTVDFDTAASAGFDFAFRGVSDPEGIVRIVDHALHQAPSADPADVSAGEGGEGSDGPA
jgi:uncharacterized membrane protein YdbT with pleckstrin-like domain